MSWLRLDDAFAQHPKFEGWPAGQRWAFLELMLYCAKYKTEGRVPRDLTLLPRAVTQKVLGAAEEAGWLDRDESGDLWIHDFAFYNPSDSTNAERQRRHRERKRNGPRNGKRNGERNGESVTSNTPAPRARAGATRIPSRPDHNDLPQAEASDSPAVPRETTPNGLPIEKEQLTAKLLASIGKDADEQTPTVIRALTSRLPEGSIVKVLESVKTGKAKNRAAYAVAALQSEFAELAERR